MMETDHHAATELALWAMNDWESYRRRTLPVLQSLEKRLLAGTYRQDLAVRFLSDALREAAKTYSLAFCSSPNDWRSLFPPAVRSKAALDILAHTLAEFELGNRLIS